MYKQGVPGFKYFVGIDSLAKVATRADRVCVLNIMGGESSEVTPVSHAFSGGNVVFGTSPGRGGQKLRTPVGDVPVYNSVREGLDAGHRFNTGVVYLPPAAVRDGVAELVRVNPELEKIVIVTEKVSVHDAREIRAIGQTNGIDIFGANGLGVADAWHRVRIGGALGGDNPGETLLKGSVAIFSNSGNFTTTIANYLATAGWGTTTSISSGKDVYIHFAAPEFVHALDNDARSKAAVLYVEPGGYYEFGLRSDKPLVACVVGRWKAKLTRAVGHAGAMAGSGDDAAAKERWFMQMFGVDGLFTPANPVCSAKGAVVTNIAHIPAALTRVMALGGVAPDFAPKGDLSLKPWFGNDQGLRLPAELDLPLVEAPAPYGAQIAELQRQTGAVFIRQSMKDASGATCMDPASQITSLHGISMLDAAREPFEANLCLAVLREPNGPNDNALANLAIAAHVNLHGDPILAAADAARAAGNAPNAVLAAAAALLGPGRVAGMRAAVAALLELFLHQVKDPLDEQMDFAGLAAAPMPRSASPTRSCSGSSCPTAPARSRPRGPRARSRPTARRPRSGCSSTRPCWASSPTPASATAATALRASSCCSTPSTPSRPSTRPGPGTASTSPPWPATSPWPTSRTRPAAARPPPRARAPSPASTTRCSAASRSTPTRARPSSPTCCASAAPTTCSTTTTATWSGPCSSTASPATCSASTSTASSPPGSCSCSGAPTGPPSSTATTSRPPPSPSSSSPAWPAPPPKSTTTPTAAATWIPVPHKN